MKRARNGLSRPERLHQDPFWSTQGSSWGINYETSVINGDGRAEVWEDFCKSARSCAITRRTCRLGGALKAAAARVLQGVWQRTAPMELQRFRDEPDDDEALGRATGGVYVYATLQQAAAVYLLRATAEQHGLRAQNVPAFGSCGIHACEEEGQLWSAQSGCVTEDVPQLLARRAADAEWLRSNGSVRLPDGRPVDVHVLEAAIAEKQLRGASEMPATAAWLESPIPYRSSANYRVVAAAEAERQTATIDEYLTRLAESATRVWYTPVALAARGAALGAHVSLVQMCNDTLERLKLTPRPAEGDARPVRYVGFLDAPGMPTHFVRLELAPDADPAFVAASLP